MSDYRHDDDDDEVSNIALCIHPEGCLLRWSTYPLQPLAHGHYSFSGCMLGMYLYLAQISTAGHQYRDLLSPSMIFVHAYTD